MLISDAMIIGRGFEYPDGVNRFPVIGFFDSLGIKESTKIPTIMDELYCWYEDYKSRLYVDYHKGNISSDEIEGLAQEHFKSIVTPDGFIKYGDVYIHELENGLICFQDSYNKLLYHPSGIILSGDVHIPYFDKDVIHFDRNSNIFTFHVTCDSKIGEKEYHFEDDMYMKRPVVGGRPRFGDFPLNANGSNPDMWMLCDGKLLFEKNIDHHYSDMYEDYCYTGT